MEIDLSRTPPHSPDAEQAVLGAVFVRPAILDDLAGVVRPDDFYSPAHQSIFAGMGRLAAAAKAVDLVTLGDELSRMGKLDEVGGPVYLAELARAAVFPAHGIQSAKIVSAMAARRRLIDVGYAVIESGFDLAADVQECGRFTQEIDAAIHGTLPHGQTVTPSQYLNDYMRDLERLQKAGGLAGVPSPWTALNRYTAGFVPGEVTVLAGRSGTGKTAMALNIAEHAARGGITVGLFSLEMTRTSLTHRLMATGATVDAQKFRNASLSDSDWAKLFDYGQIFHGLPLMICDKREMRPSELRAMCRQWKRDKGLGLLVVDYLQLMRPEVRDKVREREVSEISRSLKLLAVDLDIPILVLAQLNREAEKEKRPRLGHLRESGAIEQDADVILFIVPWKNEDAGDNVEVIVNVAKGRNNAVGDAPLIYRRKYLQFVSAASVASQEEAERHWQDI